MFIIFTALCICGGVYLFHVSDKIYQHDGASVQHVEEYNGRATDAVRHSADKVGRAQELQRGAVSNAGIIDECQSRLNRCQELLSDAESIYKDVERGDRFSGENE